MSRLMLCICMLSSAVLETGKERKPDTIMHCCPGVCKHKYQITVSALSWVRSVLQVLHPSKSQQGGEGTSRDPLWGATRLRSHRA